MKKILLKDESVYTDLVKHVVIDRALLKERILCSAYVAQDRMDPRPSWPGYHNFKIECPQPLSWLLDYIRQHYQVEQQGSFLFNHDVYGTLLLPREQSIKRNHRKEKDPPDYIMIYGVDVEKGSCDLVIEYDRELNINDQIIRLPLEDNRFYMFPAGLNYYISTNTGNQINCLLHWEGKL